MILVTGCTGFVGGHLVNTLVDEGFPVRCMARGTRDLDALPKERIAFVHGDVTRPESLAEAVEGVDAVIHLVGIIREKGEATFERIHVEGTRNILEAARSAGVRRFIYMSALGARPGDPPTGSFRGASRYQTTKWQAEELVRASGLEWIVVRPSTIIGRRGEFTQTLVDLVKKPPVIPVIGSGEYTLQPLYIGDLTQAFVKMLREDRFWGKVYEFGGPEKLMFNEMLKIVQEVLGIRKPTVHIPVGLMRPLVRVMDAVTTRFPVTSDQLAMLAENSVTDHNAFTEVFGIEPIPFREALGLSR